MIEEYAIVNTYGDDGDRFNKDSVSEIFLHETGDFTNTSTEQAIANLCQVLANKGLLTSEEFGQIIGVSEDSIWFGRDKDCPF